MLRKQNKRQDVKQKQPRRQPPAVKTVSLNIVWRRLWSLRVTKRWWLRVSKPTTGGHRVNQEISKLMQRHWKDLAAMISISIKNLSNWSSQNTRKHSPNSVRNSILKINPMLRISLSLVLCARWLEFNQEMKPGNTPQTAQCLPKTGNQMVLKMLMPNQDLGPLLNTLIRVFRHKNVRLRL